MRLFVVDGVFSDLFVKAGDFLIEHMALRPAPHQRLARGHRRSLLSRPGKAQDWQTSSQPFARNRLACNYTFGAVNCVDLHHILRQIYTNASNPFHDSPFAEGCVAAAMMTPIDAALAMGQVLTIPGSTLWDCRTRL
ncbi:hypothetical protein NK8_66450 (plasmid) [Caballeronia sp. NK8]|uniref:hypothetical protein n=1 Tax=Caballeronia sp. NK8 TaxID=140098 RepID=UPI001BB732C8|nr:hypothetical protein [Caballeronia sp. NK8]BCQ28456.1 hypothetical protein NK8_66450 [Caballeronia sp. NK8]